VLAVVVMVAGACAPRPLLVRALHARGGPLRGLVRDASARVTTGFPGTWRWQTAFLVPDCYAWTIYTTGEPDHYLFDGVTARTYVGQRLVASEAGAAAPLRTQARFAAVMNLDALFLPGVSVQPLAPGRLPAETVSGLEAVFADDGSRYRLGFDGHDRLVAVDGSVVLPPAGEGHLEARLSDFRATGRWRLPYRVDYAFRGEPLASEETLAACPDPPDLDAAAFAAPARLPACGDGAP
jgi:hypothetical protein